MSERDATAIQEAKVTEAAGRTAEWFIGEYAPGGADFDRFVLDLRTVLDAAAPHLDAGRLALVYHELYGDPCDYDGCAGGIVGRKHAEALAAAYNVENRP